MSKSNTWLLVDSRIGNTNQSRALARLLGLSYEEKKYKEIPAFRLFFANVEQLMDINTGQEPEYIISSGYRQSIIALKLKSHFPKAKIIQIYRPFYFSRKFSVIIMPEHDKSSLVFKPENLIFIPISFCDFKEETLKAEYEKYEDKIEDLPSPKIALILGGNAKRCFYSDDEIEYLNSLIAAIANKYKASWLITTSRRTPDNLKESIKKTLSSQNIYFYDATLDDPSNNPYLAFLAAADYIITTGDSISMCSEAVHTQKPVFIYTGKNLLSKKHQNFISKLVSLNLANVLTEEPNFDKNAKQFDWSQYLDQIRKKIGL